MSPHHHCLYPMSQRLRKELFLQKTEKEIDPKIGKVVSMWPVNKKGVCLPTWFWYGVHQSEVTSGHIWWWRCERFGFFRELLACHASRLIQPDLVGGQQLCALEVQQMWYLWWRVESINNTLSSFATTIADIMHLNFDEHVGMVPEFIWASPPCFMYSLMADKRCCWQLYYKCFGS